MYYLTWDDIILSKTSYASAQEAADAIPARAESTGNSTSEYGVAKVTRLVPVAKTVWEEA
jgi:hypothetical protein